MNTEQIPPGYLPGLQILEDLNDTGMAMWLLNEVHERSHMLAGGHDDQPVQAILNHSNYLSGKAKGLLVKAVRASIETWLWIEQNDSAARNLLHLAAELPVIAVKGTLQNLFWKEAPLNVAENLWAPILGAIATLSNAADAKFWRKIAAHYPKFAGMAFQVLLRISVEDAWELLMTLIPDQAVAGSVVRGLALHLKPTIGEIPQPRSLT